MGADVGPAGDPLGKLAQLLVFVRLGRKSLNEGKLGIRMSLSEGDLGPFEREPKDDGG